MAAPLVSLAAVAAWKAHRAERTYRPSVALAWWCGFVTVRAGFRIVLRGKLISVSNTLLRRSR